MSITITKEGKGYVLRAEMRVERPIDEVFAFFADAGNLDRLTPAGLHFEMLTPLPITMQAGTKIDYQLRLRGVPVRWQSEITVWDPPHRFVDQQRRGPYRWWIHEHRFAPEGNATLVSDHVQYAVPGGALTNRLLVAPDLHNIFTYRAEKLAEIFPSAGK